MSFQTKRNHPKPNPFTWTPDFQTKYDVIDEDHKKLFDAVFKIEEDLTDESALSECKAAMEDHFTREETIMQNNHYAGYEGHKSQHDKFLDKLDKMTCPVEPKDLDDAMEWLCDHIIEHDFKYKGKLKDVKVDA